MRSTVDPNLIVVATVWLQSLQINDSGIVVSDGSRAGLADPIHVLWRQSIVDMEGSRVGSPGPDAHGCCRGLAEHRAVGQANRIAGGGNRNRCIGGIGNVIMGLVFGKYWQATNKLWPLIVAHAVINIAAFAGYALLRDHISWLP